MAIFRCFLLSARRSLSSCSNLLSSFSLLNPFSPPSPPNPPIPITRPTTALPSSHFSRSAISMNLPRNNLAVYHPYTSSSDPPQHINCNPKLVNSGSETLIKPDCEKDPPSLTEIVKRSSREDMNPEELELFLKKERERECHIKLPPRFDPINEEPPSLQELFKRKRSSQLDMESQKVEFRNLLIEATKSPNSALREFHRMLAAGVAPNANTYAVLIGKLADDDGNDKMLKKAKKSLLEMVEKGMNPSVAAYTMMFEALVEAGKEAEAREMAEMMKMKGFEFDEKGVNWLLRWKIKIGDVSARDVISILFGK